MKFIPAFFFLTFVAVPLFPQADSRIADVKTPLTEVPQVVMPPLDNNALLEAELARRGPGIAPRFAENMEVNLSPSRHGRWDDLPNGNAVWRLRILSKGAKSLNLGFTKYFMPKNGTLILYSPDKKQVMGPFTPADNEEHEQLWTPILPGDELVIEVQLAKRSIPELQLHLKYVNHDFLGFAEILSGSCNLDVICGAANGWGIVDAYRDIIQSVAVISENGSTYCTGFLVNNTRQDCTPYFMTAFHCGITNSNAASLVANWNFQNSTCRQPGSPQSGGPGNGSLNNFNTGAIFRAGWSNSDFTLVELDDPVSPAANAFFAGWNAKNIAPADTTICVHHPNTDEKRISFEFQPPVISDYTGGANPNGNHLKVFDWDIGTTEDGSSGAPLFDRQKRVVGQLHGGFAACGNNEADYFGWFHSSWEGGGTPATRLKNWLDPDQAGSVTLGGRWQRQCDFFVEGVPAKKQVCSPENAVYAISVSEAFADSVMLSLSGLPDSVMAVFGSGKIPPGGQTTLTLSNTAALAGGLYTFMLEGTDNTQSTVSELSLFVANQAPGPVSLVAPGDGTKGLGSSVAFQWDASEFEQYAIEIATDTAFTDIVEVADNIAGGSYQSGVQLSNLSAFYWRIKATNICGEGAWSAFYNFSTGSVFCQQKASPDVPKIISNNSVSTVTSDLEVPVGGYVENVAVSLNINHTWIGDLTVSLKSPTGTTVVLMRKPGNGDCQNLPIMATFEDQAPKPYFEIDNICNSGGASITGSFRPFQPLSAFKGEPSQGQWQLIVHDGFEQDGGTLTGWGIDLCSTVPGDTSLIALANDLENCAGDSSAFSFITGTGFRLDTSLTFNISNLPAGATASFHPDTATAGKEVELILGGVPAGGDYTLNLTATDGASTGSTQIHWSVKAPPNAPILTAPTPNTTGIPLNPNLSWMPVPGSTYRLMVAKDSAMTDIVFSGNTNNTSRIVTGLMHCTTYYWAVTADNGCGQSTSSVYSFTTLNDFAFNVNAASVNVCNTGMAANSLTIGKCFKSNGVTLSASGLPAGASIAFGSNPAPPGVNVSISLTLVNATPGLHQITLHGTDGTNTVTKNFNLNVLGGAPAPTLVLPANGAAAVPVQPVFDWDPVGGANNYKFELASDTSFGNMVAMTTTTQSAYTLPMPLANSTTYYWRVTAFNNCGSASPNVFSFTTETVNAVSSLNGVSVKVHPNPTGNTLFIKFSEPVRNPVEAAVFSINGIRLQQERFPAGIPGLTLDMNGYSNGIYLLKIVSADAVLTQRIIISK